MNDVIVNKADYGGTFVTLDSMARTAAKLRPDLRSFKAFEVALSHFGVTKSLESIGFEANPAFIFPEMLHTQYVPATWVPKFVDYLSLGFWTATAFSPTDISAVRPWAKLLMITEAAVSLGIAGLVIARAINILA